MTFNLTVKIQVGHTHVYYYQTIIESVDSISRDGPDTPIIITSPVAIYFFAAMR